MRGTAEAKILLHFFLLEIFKNPVIKDWLKY